VQKNKRAKWFTRTGLKHSAKYPAQRGGSMVEFVVVYPVMTLMGLAMVQYAMAYNAKSLLNHASFMAARAGSTGHAQLSAIKKGMVSAMVPMYGGGRNATELAQARARAEADVAVHTQIEILNPTQESFQDWNAPGLQQMLETGSKRVIPNGVQHYGNARDIRPNSGQSLQDANLLKLRITYGYEPKVPMVGQMYTSFLRLLRTNEAGSFHNTLLEAKRIPMVTHITLRMQSHAIEDVNVSTPGLGNNGRPTPPRDPASSPPGEDRPPADPQENNPRPPSDPASGSGPTPPAGQPTTPTHPGSNTPPAEDPQNLDEVSGPVCGTPVSGSVPTDGMFDFGSAQLNDIGKRVLDEVVRRAQSVDFDSVTLKGYTDPLGDEGQNRTLSLNRARAVRDYLVSKGFPNKPFDVQGLGSQDPVVSQSNCPASAGVQIQRACLSPNRRVEYVLNGSNGSRPSSGSSPASPASPASSSSSSPAQS
jgi:outer membrane protein OmpA-like peptidoglycan-associated protein